MANTTTENGRVIEITGLDADWQGSVDTSMSRMKIESIQFNPSAADDVMIIHDGGLNNASLMDVTCQNVYDQRVKYFHPPVWADPVIDISDCTLGTAANAKVIITIV